MKKCKRCKREVSNVRWSHKDNMCQSCVAKKKYRESRPELMKLLKELKKKTKEELINIIVSHKGSRGHTNMLFAQKNWQIRHFRTRILKVRNQLDYLLKHPYSTDSNFKTKPHRRDNKSKSIPIKSFKKSIGKGRKGNE